jgi:hypothetical protein
VIHYPFTIQKLKSLFEDVGDAAITNCPFASKFNLGIAIVVSVVNNAFCDNAL